MSDAQHEPAQRWEDFAAELFEYEDCEECGLGAAEHNALIVFGNWFAQCKHRTGAAPTERCECGAYWTRCGYRERTHAWCDSCDPAHGPLCHYCHGRGYSTHPAPNVVLSTEGGAA